MDEHVRERMKALDRERMTDDERVAMAEAERLIGLYDRGSTPHQIGMAIYRVTKQSMQARFLEPETVDAEDGDEGWPWNVVFWFVVVEVGLLILGINGTGNFYDYGCRPDVCMSYVIVWWIIIGLGMLFAWYLFRRWARQ